MDKEGTDRLHTMSREKKEELYTLLAEHRKRSSSGYTSVYEAMAAYNEELRLLSKIQKAEELLDDKEERS